MAVKASKSLAANNVAKVCLRVHMKIGVDGPSHIPRALIVAIVNWLWCQSDLMIAGQIKLSTQLALTMIYCVVWLWGSIDILFVRIVPPRAKFCKRNPNAIDIIRIKGFFSRPGGTPGRRLRKGSVARWNCRVRVVFLFS